MDWARDNTGVNEKDMDTVFKYEEKFTTVVRILENDAVRTPSCLTSLCCLHRQGLTFATETAYMDARDGG